MTVRLTLDRAALAELLRGPNGPVVQHVAGLCRQVENRAKVYVGVDTGRLRSSMQTALNVESSRVVGRVGTSVQYGLYHHEGTGIYGPARRPITPRAGGVLVFTPKGASGPVFARSVRGSKPNRFLVKAFHEVVPYPVSTPGSGR